MGYVIAGILIGLVTLMFAAIFIFGKKQYAIGACFVAVGVILILGMFVVKNNLTNEKVTETPAPTEASETEAPTPTATILIETIGPTTEPTATATLEPTAVPTETPTPSPSGIAIQTPVPGPTATPVPPGAYIESHYDPTTIVKPENWNGKTIYLTFDDGPSDSTKRVLDNMAKYNVKVTFFVIGTALNSSLPVTKRAIEEGHSIGVHAYTHDYATIYSSVEGFTEDFNKLVDIMHTKLNYNPTINRFPGGTSNGSSKQYCKGIMTELVKIVPSWGYTYVDWNVSPEDAMSKKSVETIFENTKQSILQKSGNSIFVLMHDFGGMNNTADAALKLVEWGLENGYAFDRVTPETKGIYKHAPSN